MLFAEIDLRGLVELKQHHDMAGYYNRGEIFRLNLVRERPRALQDVAFERTPVVKPSEAESPFDPDHDLYQVAAQ